MKRHSGSNKNLNLAKENTNISPPMIRQCFSCREASSLWRLLSLCQPLELSPTESPPQQKATNQRLQLQPKNIYFPLTVWSVHSWLLPPHSANTPRAEGRGGSSLGTQRSCSLPEGKHCHFDRPRSFSERYAGLWLLTGASPQKQDKKYNLQHKMPFFLPKTYFHDITFSLCIWTPKYM